MAEQSDPLRPFTPDVDIGKDTTDPLTGPQRNLETPAERRFRLINQVVMVLGASLGHVGIALAAAWPNPAVPDLQRSNSTIYGSSITLSSWQLDMLGSAVSIGVLPGTWIWGWLSISIGRRKAMMLLVIPYTIGWSLVTLAVSPSMMLIGRVVHGMCVGATFVTANTYIIELPDASVRGALAVLPEIALDSGFVLTASLGLILRWYDIGFIGAAIILLQTLVMICLPESPSYLAVKGREAEAKRYLRKLRGPNVDIDQELEDLQDVNRDKSKERILTVLKNRNIQKGLATVFILFFVQNFCGLMVFSVNMTRIFLEAGSTLDEYVSSVLVFLVRLIGNILACLILDKFGRRASLMVSLAVMMMCLLVMGTYHFVKIPSEVPTGYSSSSNSTIVETVVADDESRNPLPSYSWIPLVCLMVYMMSSSMGAGPVPGILNAEYFPTAVRSQLSGICMVAGSVLNFVTLQVFTPLQDLLTLGGLCFAYAAVSAFGIVFTFFCVRETKGKPVG